MMDPFVAPPWWAEAACLGAGPRIFFPTRGAESKTAKAICRSCPVRAECLEDALKQGYKFGVWGGLSERERRRVRRDRARRERAGEAA